MVAMERTRAHQRLRCSSMLASRTCLSSENVEDTTWPLAVGKTRAETPKPEPHHNRIWGFYSRCSLDSALHCTLHNCMCVV